MLSRLGPPALRTGPVLSWPRVLGLVRVSGGQLLGQLVAKPCGGRPDYAKPTAVAGVTTQQKTGRGGGGAAVATHDRECLVVVLQLVTAAHTGSVQPARSPERRDAALFRTLQRPLPQGVVSPLVAMTSPTANVGRHH